MPRRASSLIALATSILVCALLLLGSSRKLANDPAFGEINSIVRSLSEISGLSEKHTVPYGRMSKGQLRHFLNKRMKKMLKPDEIYADELSLKMFGLVPQDFDLRKSTVDLLTEQAAAFYDYDEKKLFLLEDASFEEETTTLAHELAHALADQHFNLDKFMDESSASDDEDLAHTAVVEGQASWLMIAYDLKQQGQPPVPTKREIESVGDSGGDSSGEFPVLKKSPLYIRESLLFPYAQGTLFFDAVYKKLGKQAFSAVFNDAPADSGQIIHPDRYFAHQKATVPELPALALNEHTEKLADGAIGEFDHEILLHQYVSQDEAKVVAPHLRGGVFRIYEVGKDHAPVLEYASEWDSEAEAATFFADYQKILRGKSRHCEVSNTNADLFAGSNDMGYFVAWVNDDTVTSIEGLQNVGEWQKLVLDTLNP